MTQMEELIAIIIAVLLAAALLTGAAKYQAHCKECGCCAQVADDDGDDLIDVGELIDMMTQGE